MASESYENREYLSKPSPIEGLLSYEKVDESTSVLGEKVPTSSCQEFDCSPVKPFCFDAPEGN